MVPCYCLRLFCKWYVAWKRPFNFKWTGPNPGKKSNSEFLHFPPIPSLPSPKGLWEGPSWLNRPFPEIPEPQVTEKKNKSFKVYRQRCSFFYENISPSLPNKAGHVSTMKPSTAEKKKRKKESFLGIWVFPKIVVPPKSSILIGFSIIFTIHFGVFPLFLDLHPSERNGPSSTCSWLICWSFAVPDHPRHEMHKRSRGTKPQGTTEGEATPNKPGISWKSKGTPPAMPSTQETILHSRVHSTSLSLNNPQIRPLFPDRNVVLAWWGLSDSHDLNHCQVQDPSARYKTPLKTNMAGWKITMLIGHTSTQMLGIFLPVIR